MIARIGRVSYVVSGFGGALTRDLAQGVSAAVSFFPALRWADVARRIDGRVYPRAEVAELLETTMAGSDAPEAMENIRSLKQKNTYVVATGQQAGFLGGPLYTLHKALTAVKLAQRYEKEAAGAAHFVPLFWVAGDDHDLAEIDHAWFLCQDGALSRVSAAAPPPCSGRSACDVILPPDSLVRAREEFKALPKECQAAGRFLELYEGRSLSGAFAALMKRWFGGLGLVVVESQMLRPLAKELLLRELEEYDTTYRLIQEAGMSLARNGYDAGFGSGLRAPHFFVALEPGKHRVRLEPAGENGEAGFREHGPAAFREAQAADSQAGAPAARAHFSKAELAALIRSRPELFSFAAALRPVLQQSVFPVVAAVLGPGEISYWAQLLKVHEHFGAVWPVVVPRATLTLLDARGRRALRKIGIEPGAAELFAPFEVLRGKMLASGALASRLEQQRARIMGELQALMAEVQAADGGSGPMLEKTRARIEHELRRVIEKTATAVQEREEPGLARVRYLSALVRPRNSSQERVLAFAQFMVQYPSLLEDLLSVVEPGTGEHLVVELD